MSTGSTWHSSDPSEIHSPNGDKLCAGHSRQLWTETAQPRWPGREETPLPPSTPCLVGWGRECNLCCSHWRSPLGLPAVKLHGDPKTSHPTFHLWPQRLWAFLDLQHFCICQAAAFAPDPMQGVPCPAALLHSITPPSSHQQIPLSSPSYHFKTSGKFPFSFLTYK